jgi:hypothetical protein
MWKLNALGIDMLRYFIRKIHPSRTLVRIRSPDVKTDSEEDTMEARHISQTPNATVRTVRRRTL